MAIVNQIEWAALDRLVEVQQRNRETHVPVISLFRWWARRSHAVAGAILDAARAEFGSGSFLVADPFSGGGTVAFEAVRRGHPVYAQDLYPWPSSGLATALTKAHPGDLVRASQELLEKLEPYRARYQGLEGSRQFELTHVIRVRVAPCQHCGGAVHLFRDPFVSLASRKKDERRAFLGCEACGGVSLRALDAQSFKCDSCGRRSAAGRTKSYNPKPTVFCPHCGCRAELASLLATAPAWKPVLVQMREVESFKKASPILRAVKIGDPVSDINRCEEEVALRVAIPPGVETAHLLREGFLQWADLYTHRQAQTLLGALREVDKLDFTTAVRDRLRLAVIGACEMAGYLCRWSRTHPKAFEALANHRYSRSTVVVETNLLSPVGRGTIPRRLRAAEKGLIWLKETAMPEKTVLCSANSKRRPLRRGALIVTGSSSRQILQDGAAQLVVTDPPYHDDLQYGELARLFHAWLSVQSSTPPPTEEAEAVPNTVRSTSTEQYEQIVKECLAESRRTLSPNGRLVLTFHNNNLAAWTALRNALSGAGFFVVGLATVSAENPADHSKRNKRSFLCDLVIECAPKRDAHVAVSGRNDTEQRRNLLAVGLALAESVNDRLGSSLKESYEAHLRRMGEAEKLIG